MFKTRVTQCLYSFAPLITVGLGVIKITFYITNNDTFALSQEYQIIDILFYIWMILLNVGLVVLSVVTKSSGTASFSNKNKYRLIAEITAYIICEIILYSHYNLLVPIWECASLATHLCVLVLLNRILARTPERSLDSYILSSVSYFLVVMVTTGISMTRYLEYKHLSTFNNIIMFLDVSLQFSSSLTVILHWVECKFNYVRDTTLVSEDHSLLQNV